MVLRTSEVRVNGGKKEERQQLIHSGPSALFSSLSYALYSHQYLGLMSELFHLHFCIQDFVLFRNAFHTHSASIQACKLGYKPS